MRKLLLASLFLASLNSWSAEVLDLVSYHLNVSARKSELVYSHNVYDRNHVPRVTLVKTIFPGKFGSALTEYSTYDLQFKDASGNVTQTISLEKEMYLKFRSKIEKAKLETAISAWTKGCDLRVLLDNRRGYFGILSMCEENTATDSLGTIEADSNTQ